MLVIQRRQVILEQLRRKGAASVRDLALSLGCPEVTVRRDLASMARRGIVRRTRGGATMPRWPQHPDVGFLHDYAPTHTELEMASVARELIRPGDAVVICGAGAALALALQVSTLGGLTVVTNSLRIANALRDADGIDLLVAGGFISRPSLTLMRPEIDGALQGVRTATAFVSAAALTSRHGMTTPSFAEAASTRAAVSTADHLVALVDPAGIGRDYLCQIAPWSAIDLVITAAGCESAELGRLEATGVEIRVAG